MRAPRRRCRPPTRCRGAATSKIIADATTPTTTECPASASMHASRLPTNIDRDEAAVASAVVPSDVIDLDRCIPAALPDSSQQPNQPKYEDGDQNAFGFDALSGLVQPTPADGPAQP
jgi:hypothetical protein